MATRFYLPSSGTPPVTPGTPTGWTQTTGWAAFPAPTVKTNTGLFNGSAVTELVGTQLDRVYISDPIGAQTISGTFSAVITTSESSSTGELWLDIHIKVISNNGATVRGTLYAGSTATAVSTTVGAENEEMATTGQSRIKDTIALTPVTAQANDRIMFEIGAKASAAATRTSTRRYGDPVATADFALASGLGSSAGTPWIELSADVMSQTFTDVLAADAVSSFTIGGTTTPAQSSILAASASGSMAIAGTQLGTQLGTLPLAGAAALSIVGSEARNATIAAVALSGATMAALRQQNASIAAAASSGVAIGALRTQSGLWVAAAAGKLTPNTGATAVVSMRGTPALALAPLMSYLRTLVAGASSSMLLLVQVIEQPHSGKRVIAVVLDDGKRLALLDLTGGAAELLPAAGLAELLGAGH